MNMTKDFDFKQFKVKGGNSGMPVSTDGILLGAWIDLSDTIELLDIGTGTGLLSLMCAQRNKTVSIQAIDIEKQAIDAAKLNFSQSPWESRLTLHHADILTHFFNTRFDNIICNPPYFNSGEQARNPSRATARHTSMLSHSELLTRCNELLTDTGKASFVLPVFEGEHFMSLALTKGWYTSRLCYVKTTERKQVSRILLELKRLPCAVENQSLTIHSGSGYSDQFVALTRDFYLKM